MLTHEEVRQVLTVDAVSHVLLYGPHGTGKTYLAEHATQHGQVLFSITCTDTADEAELRGFFSIGPQGMQWTDGLVAAAWGQAGLLVLNEVNLASPGVLSFLYGALDDPAVAALTLPNGSTIRPKKGFRCIATMNGDPACLPAPLMDRFGLTIEMEAIDPAAFAGLLPEVAKAAQRMIGQGNRSIRAWRALDRLLRGAIDLPLACKAVFGAEGQDVADALALAWGK